VTRMPPVITLTGSPTRREGFQEAERVRSHSSHVTTPPQGVVGSDGETEKPSCGVAASPRVKRRSVATGSSAKVPGAPVLNESTSPEVQIPAA